MIDISPLIKKSFCYNLIKKEKKEGRLSHAYLIIFKDEKYLEDALKIFASLLVCENDGCGECRKCKLIKDNGFADAAFFPKNDESVLVDDINELIEQSYIKPIEGEKKIFCISKAETMNVPSQNKLLKTLEEPPKGVYIILGAKNEYPLLPTVKSRVKKLEIPSFTDEEIFDLLEKECEDKEKLKGAIICGDGTVGKAEELYNDKNLQKVISYVEDVIVNMNSSKDVLKYSSLAVDLKGDYVKDILDVFPLAFRQMLLDLEGNFAKSRVFKLDDATGFTRGAIVYALERCFEAEERKKFNANATMLIEWLLFQILEGKYKWQKS